MYKRQPLTADDLEIPEGFELDENLSKDFLAVMNDAEKSPKERANALMQMHSEVLKSASEQISTMWAEAQKEGKAAIEADKEIGGDKLETTLAGVNRLVEKYAPDVKELRTMFDITGAGNNLAMVKFLNAIADDVLEGSPVTGTAPSTGSKDQAAILFPDQN